MLYFCVHQGKANIMNYNINPFQELYVTDDPNPNVYVGLFSNALVDLVMPLFRPGNVILKGVQGTGKSMLLNLFRPKIRLAFHESNIDFPIPKEWQSFISAGINISRSGILNFGHRPIEKEFDLSEMPLYFGDFLNYFIVADILNNLKIQITNSNAFNNIVNKSDLDNFSIELSKQDCWFGYLDGCHSFNDIFKKINERIKSYRQFHTNRLYNLEKTIQETKTSPGEPISRTAQLLKETNVVSQGTNFFIRIDQVEILLGGDIVNKKLGYQYRQIINKILGDRDARVSYKIGTRRYDWAKELKIFGTENKLENLRDFRIIDIDDILRRKEDIKSYIFPQFAEDVFRRRLINAEIIKEKEPSKDLLKKIFGSFKSDKKIKYYVSTNTNPKKLIGYDQDWPENWKKFLLDTCKNDPLEAVLAATWVRQGGKKDYHKDRLTKSPPKNRPWEKTWWRKERIQQSLMQIASRSSQRMLWAGKEDIIGLSSGNISIFISICYEIWEMFLRNEIRKKESRENPLKSKNHIDHKIQSMGIFNASNLWYEKISEQPNGDDRQSFINFLGTQFKKWLSDDKAMSYPGRNGFSIAKELFDTSDQSMAKALRSFLNDSVDYGDLFDAPHTTKKTDRKERTKWYLTPILSPYFQIPHQHIKEPYYVEDMMELFEWIVEKSGACKQIKNKKKLLKSFQPKKKKKKSDNSRSLFDYLSGKIKYE